jgi:hypothetical protein
MEDEVQQAGHDLTQTFDWIFFAIILLPTAALVWDWFRNK